MESLEKNKNPIKDTKHPNIIAGSKTYLLVDAVNNKTDYIQGIICTIAAMIFNCYVDRIFNLLPTSAATYLNNGISVCCRSTFSACGLGATIYIVSRVVFSYFNDVDHSTFRREVTDLLVTAAVGAVFNLIATFIFAEAQIVILPTLLAGAALGAGIYIINLIGNTIINSIFPRNYQEKLTNKIRIPQILEEEFAVFESKSKIPQENDQYLISLTFMVKSENSITKKSVDVDVADLIVDDDRVYFYGTEFKIDVTNNEALMEIADDIDNILKKEAKKTRLINETKNLKKDKKELKKAMQLWRKAKDKEDDEHNKYQITEKKDFFSITRKREYEIKEPILSMIYFKDIQEDQKNGLFFYYENNETFTSSRQSNNRLFFYENEFLHYLKKPALEKLEKELLKINEQLEVGEDDYDRYKAFHKVWLEMGILTTDSKSDSDSE